MIGIILILLIAVYLAYFFPVFKPEKEDTPRNARYDMQMKKLWSAAQASMRDHKPLRAEKALLTILKFDEKNAAAYNRLGILYAKEQKFNEAIECFEIAQSLDNNPSSLHNVGLIYLETGAYEKAAMAFEQAIEIEGSVAARHIALAKAKERLGHTKSAIESLEKAYSLDHSVSTLRQILAIHEATGDAEALADTTARIEAQIAENNASKPKRTTTRSRSTTSRTKSTTKTPSRAVAARTSTKALARTTARTVAKSSAPTRTVTRRPTTRRKQI